MIVTHTFTSSVNPVLNLKSCETPSKSPTTQGATDEEDSAISVWCSNDYLGMSSHPDVTKTVVEHINKHGVGKWNTGPWLVDN